MNENLRTWVSRDISATQQFFDSFRRSEPLEPERALLAAILEDAIHDYRKYKKARDREGKERFREAEEWIMESGNTWIFSFNHVCELLNLDPDYVRRALHARNGRASDRGQAQAC
jgi:hypothetical protein